MKNLTASHIKIGGRAPARRGFFPAPPHIKTEDAQAREGVSLSLPYSIIIIIKRAKSITLPYGLQQRTLLIRIHRTFSQCINRALMLRHGDHLRRILRSIRIIHSKSISVLIDYTPVSWCWHAVLLLLILAGSAAHGQGTQKITCPDHYAIRIPKHQPFTGSLLSCENFDAYFKLINEGRTDEAKALLEIVKGEPKGSKPGEIRREPLPLCPEVVTEL